MREPWFRGFPSDRFRAIRADLQFFLQSHFVNGAAGGFSADILISVAVFWVWSWRDAARYGVKGWLLALPAVFLVGLPLPLYLSLWEQDRPT